MHVPVDRPVIIELSSKDVIHNFALPHMRMAQDAIPGQIIPMWFKPIKKGSYEVVCGQLCGYGHYSMKGSFVVDDPAEYQAWLKERAELSGSSTAPAPADRPRRTSRAGCLSSACGQPRPSRAKCQCHGRRSEFRDVVTPKTPEAHHNHSQNRSG